MSRTWTDAELKLCRRLHELNVRPEIRIGDWYLDTRHSLAQCGPFLCDRSMIPDLRDIFVLLWSWERAREWMREKKIFINIELIDLNKGGVEAYIDWDKEEAYHESAQTDLEHLLAAMVQVAERK